MPPFIFETPEELKKAVEDYFATTKRVTLAGLAVHLGVDRQTLYNYEKRDGYGDIVKRARDRVEARYEERLIYESNPTGVIFALKNMSWRDKSERDITTKGESINTIKVQYVEAEQEDNETPEG